MHVLCFDHDVYFVLDCKVLWASAMDKAVDCVIMIIHFFILPVPPYILPLTTLTPTPISLRSQKVDSSHPSSLVSTICWYMHSADGTSVGPCSR